MLTQYLLAVHQCDVPQADREVFANREMRTLNHEHIFALPFVKITASRSMR